VSNLSSWWSHVGLQRKLQVLIQGFLVIILLAAQYWILGQFEAQVVRSAKERTVAVADGAINGLNTLMVTAVEGTDVISDPKARALFIQKMGASDNVRELRVIRSKGTNDEFGEGLPQEQPADELDREVLASGKQQFRFSKSNTGEDLLRVVLPFIAMKEFRTSNCLKCHGVEENSVLGAASITLDISEDMARLAKINRWMWLGQLFLQLVLYFVVGMIVRKLLLQLGGEPSEAVEVAQRVTQGDFSKPVLRKSDDNSSLIAQLDIMQNSLVHVVSDVRSAAERLENASSEIAQGNQDLSARTESQASSLEQTAASMEQLSSAVKQNAETARKANALVLSASAVASQGGDAVRQVVDTMREINGSSHRIADIISVIDGIAFQTNILALNAAVEAARAGEQGRGFAVVAAEVRSLAGRSANAAKEIKDLISASVDRVDHGTSLVDKAGATMDEIVNAIAAVTTLMADITTASSEQSEGVAQVSETVSQMDRMTQQNAALVEEMAAAASSLRSQASELVEVVRVFQLPAASLTYRG
jgi:methyl-accepting chemotaxis protein